MTLKPLLPLFAILLSTPVLAQPAAPPVAEPAAAPAAAPTPSATRAHETVRITLTTALGPIVLELESQRAPLSTAAFLRYVDQRKLDGTGFYRALDMGRGYGLVQFGTRNDPARTLPAVAHEPTSQTGLSHTDGAISLARGAPGSARGDFFIVLGDLVSLDAQPGVAGADPDGYAVFGRVVDGMDVVRQIVAQPTDPNAGEGAMRGQILATPVAIANARRTPVETGQPAP